MDESFIRMRTFSCVYARNADGGFTLPLGDTIGDQTTAFFDAEDAWPVTHSLTVVPDEDAHRVTHVMMLTWMPRHAYMQTQTKITARAQQLLAEWVARLNEETEDDAAIDSTPG